jgi:hypothetical protein
MTFLEQLVVKMKEEHGLTTKDWILYQDGAPYHKSKQTQTKLWQLGLQTLIAAP